MSERIKVGMACWKIARDGDLLVTFGLGSCVGLGLWDEKEKVAVMAHIMLPDSKQIRLHHEVNPAKFADTALTAMLNRLQKMGIPKERLRAKIVGGANMFNFDNKPSNSLSVGTRNIAAVKAHLKAEQIPLVAEDTGGSSGRSLEFSSSDGKIRVRTALAGEREL
jgi:chemotaxis protein CheD